MTPATWKVSFKKFGAYDWDFYIDGIFQGWGRTQTECLKYVTEIAKGERELTTVNIKPIRPKKSPNGRGKGKKKRENNKAK